MRRSRPIRRPQFLGSAELEQHPHPVRPPIIRYTSRLCARGMDNVFSTHPSTENRVAALARLSREMGLGGFGTAIPGGTMQRG
jgi:heat shock protein HtpX